MEGFCFSAAQGFFLEITPVGPEVRASLSLPRESDKERPGSPPDPRARRQPSSGGCRPGLPLDSRPNPGLHCPLGGLGPLRRRFLPRGAGLRRQGRHPRKANTERRSGRGTRVCGVIPFRFCCPAAIKYPAGAVSSLPVESLAVVPPAATGGGGNGSGTERRLVLAVGFQGVYPLVALWLLSGNSESSISGVALRAEQK